jgi:hypothetical protein
LLEIQKTISDEERDEISQIVLDDAQGFSRMDLSSMIVVPCVSWKVDRSLLFPLFDNGSAHERSSNEELSLEYGFTQNVLVVVELEIEWSEDRTDALANQELSEVELQEGVTKFQVLST